jgi:hypothetical protein
MLGRPVKVERIDLDADDVRLRVNEASVDYADQKMTIRGEVRRSATGLVVDAQVDSSGIVLDRLLPASARGELDAAASSAQKTPEALAIWPLPVQGTLSLRAGFVEFHRYRVEPLVATVDVEPERLRMNVAEAALCGVAFPFTLELTRQGMVGAVQLRAKGQQLVATALCMSDERTVLTGVFDLTADLRTRGKLGELMRTLEGSIDFDARNGKVMKWGLLGNILALKSITSLLTKDALRLDQGGFDYRELILRGRLAGGRLLVDESAFDSPALGLAAKGSVRLADRDADLIVLVAPFSRIDRLVRRIPIAGYIFGGTLTSVPVSVRGDLRDPLVVPLGPTAVTAELLGIFQRTFKRPGRLVQPLQQSTLPEPSAR